MSFNLRNIRQVPNAPNDEFVSHLAKRVAKFATDQANQDLESKDDIYSSGQDVDSKIAYHTFTANRTFDAETEYFPPLEPDLDKNTIWLQGHNMGNSTRDLSCFNNVNSIVGDPILVDGGEFDYGINTGGSLSLALRFNRVDDSGLSHESAYREHINIDDNSRIHLDNSSSISYFWRVRPLSTGLDEGKRRTLYLKTETDSIEGEAYNGVRVSIDPVNKRWVIQIKRDGTFFSKETGINKCIVGTVYDIFLTYNAGTIHFYLAKTGDSTMTDESLSNSGYTEEWGPDTSDESARLFKRGPLANDGAFHGDFYDFKIYRNYTVSQTDADRHWTNKWSISDIPFGQVMIADYYSANGPTGGGGGHDFEADSFEADSFEV